MINRLFIDATVSDTRADVKLRRIRAAGHNHIQHLRLVDVYTIDKILTSRQLAELGDALASPVTHQAYVNSYQPKHPFTWVIEVGYLPGVTDNIATTMKEIIVDRLGVSFGRDDGVYTSQLTFLSGDIPKKEVLEIASGFINPLIERVAVKDRTVYTKDHGMDRVVPKVRLAAIPRVDTVDLNVTDAELTDLGKYGIRNADGTKRGPLALDLLSLKAIQAHFRKLKRSPTDIELESIAQTWSEHCKHTIFSRPLDDISDGLYKHYIQRATIEVRIALGKKDFCVSVFKDNSGAIAFDAKYAITHKVETHNSPSALDPFGGAVTGIVGVNRDALGFGLGAKPIANTYGFCLADPADDTPLYRDKARAQRLLSPRRIMDGVIAGVNSGGNCSGIPTPQGFLYFDPRYKGKPLVFAGTVGIIPYNASGRTLVDKKARPGDYIVMIGGRVGIDGIHGATFSSEALTGGSPATAVQIGDPITQKKLSDLLIGDARGAGLYTSITDNGAGGLSCSVAEMAKESGGCEVDLETVPLKYAGLAPWQIWISESQERMTLAVPKNKWKQLKQLASLRSVEATVIGKFTSSGKCVVRYNKKTIMNVGMEFLHNGLPNFQQTSTWKEKKPARFHHITIKNWTKTVLSMLKRPNLSSFEWISMQYDHEVQGTSIIKPLQGNGRVNGDASVLRPVLTSKRGIVLTQALYPRYSDIDTYAMAASAIDTAVRNAVAAGADPGRIALLDNFCWCSGKDPYRLGQLKRAVKACYDYATAYRTPFISGKDSMFNDFRGFDAKGKAVAISIPPTLLISAVGMIDDVTKAVSLDFKLPGDLVYVLGETHEELGASEYVLMQGEVPPAGQSPLGNVPAVHPDGNKKLYEAIANAIEKRLIASAQSVHHGGLVIALAKSLIGGGLGCVASFKNLPGSAAHDDAVFFSESQGRVVVSIAPDQQKKFEKLFDGLPYKQIGVIAKDTSVHIQGMRKDTVVHTSVADLKRAYAFRFAGY